MWIVLQNNELALRNLKHLFSRCVHPNHSKIAARGVEFYQEKGSDFSEEICTLFVNTCLSGKNAKLAAELIAKPHYRIGAWLTKGTTYNLLSALAQCDGPGELPMMLDIMEMTVAKGLRVQSVETLELALQKAIEMGDRELYVRAVAVAEKVLAEAAAVDELKVKFPEPMPTDSEGATEEHVSEATDAGSKS